MPTPQNPTDSSKTTLGNKGTEVHDLPWGPDDVRGNVVKLGGPLTPQLFTKRKPASPKPPVPTTPRSTKN